MRWSRPDERRGQWAGYGIAVVGVAVAALCLPLLPPAARVSMLPLLIPVMLAAFVGGLGPGLVATGAAAAAAIAMSQVNAAAATAGDAITSLALFIVAGALASALLGSARRGRAAVPDREGVEEALRKSEDRYRAIVDTQSEMVCRFRPDGEILFLNGGYARARGTTPDALIGSNFWDFVADSDRLGVRSMLERLTPEMPEIRIENRFETADGVRWTLWTNRALSFDKAGRCTEAQSTGIDITDRKEAEEALREASERKTEFLAVLGHELRNPLAPLSAGVELLEQSAISVESMVKVRAMMKRQLDHLSRLVEDLLDLSRISRGEVALRIAPLDVREVVEAAVELCLPAIVERQHRISVEAGHVMLPADGDFQRLTQVLGNVLANAAKYTPPGGSIDITAAIEGQHVVVRIRDTGYGLPPERLESLFEMFTQIPEHRERTGGGGLGIGLALSRQLVTRHGGSIEAKSNGIGLGSEFVVRLPLGKEIRGEGAAQPSNA